MYDDFDVGVVVDDVFVLVEPAVFPLQFRQLGPDPYADTRIPFAGGYGTGRAGVEWPPVQQGIDRWRQLDRCAPNGAATVNAVITTAVWPPCRERTEVRLVTIAGVGMIAVAWLFTRIRKARLVVDPAGSATTATVYVTRSYRGCEAR